MEDNGHQSIIVRARDRIVAKIEFLGIVHLVLGGFEQSGVLAWREIHLSINPNINYFQADPP